MASTYSTNLKIELIGSGEQSGTWGTTTNTNLGTALEEAITGVATADFPSDANLTLAFNDVNTTQEFRNLVLNVTSTGSLTATRDLTVPTIEKQYLVWNNTSGSQAIQVKTAAGTGVTVPNGAKAHLIVDGTNVVEAVTRINGTDIPASSTLASLTGTQTLTNKTFDLASNTLTGTTAEFNTALSDGSFATLAGTETLTNKSVDLASNTLTGTTAEFNTALSDGSFATLAGTETLTNKTFDLASNTLTGTAAEFNAALSDGSFATSSGTETLTNKTFNLANNTLTGTTAEFNTALSDGSFATLAGTETLTNKTITAPSGIVAGDLGYTSTAVALTATDVQDALDELCTLPSAAAKTAGYTLTAADTGGMVRTDSTITVPSGVFAVGDTVVVYNNSGSGISIARSSVTMYWIDGLNADRTLAQRGLATLVCVDTDTFVITGQGLS